MKNKILVYGAYGYTGRLIAKLAAEQSANVLLSGRNPDKVAALAAETGLPGQAADLRDETAMDALMADVAVVLHCAGPFVHTWEPMLDACKRNKVHYLDITGEIDVFEGLAAQSGAGSKAGIMLMPGVGFDVVPTDCVAARLKEQLPDAQELHLVIKSVGGGISHGTASTMVLSLGEGSKVRRDGRIVASKAGSPTITADLGRGPVTAVGIPWGDVSTAWHTTGIPNITTYFAVPKSQIRMLKFSNLIGPLLRSKWVRGIAQRRIDKRAAGPGDERRKKAKSIVWGMVRNAKGEERSHRIESVEGYTLTAMAALHIARRVVDGDFKPGYQTPAGCYGSGLLDEIVDNFPPE